MSDGVIALIPRVVLPDLELVTARFETETEMLIQAGRAGHKIVSLPIRTMRKIILSGQLGQLRAIHILAYSDWMLRPRTSDELDPTQGGGIPYRQGPHQIDTVRMLGGGKLRSVRAMTGQWMPERPIPGY